MKPVSALDPGSRCFGHATRLDICEVGRRKLIIRGAKNNCSILLKCPRTPSPLRNVVPAK